METYCLNLLDEKSEPVYGYYEGDHIYGITPVKLALLSGRRNITELLIQSSMEMSQKKDELSAKEILSIAERLHIPTREFSKHDLNMLADNRPVIIINFVILNGITVIIGCIYTIIYSYHYSLLLLIIMTVIIILTYYYYLLLIDSYFFIFFIIISYFYRYKLDNLPQHILLLGVQCDILN